MLALGGSPLVAPGYGISLITVEVRSAAETDAGQRDHTVQNKLKLITRYTTDIESVWLRFVVIDD